MPGFWDRLASTPVTAHVITQRSGSRFRASVMAGSSLGMSSREAAFGVGAPKADTKDKRNALAAWRRVAALESRHPLGPWLVQVMFRIRDPAWSREPTWRAWS